MKNIFFTSDAHFGHTNVLGYDNRPFDTIKDHDETLIKNWNETVGDNRIYYLGDFGLAHPHYLEQIMIRLSGEKFFIKGNHDDSRTIKLYQKYGTFLGNLEEVFEDGYKIVLCHYKMATWRGSGRATWHLYGHSHGHSENLKIGLSMDVGINL